MTSLLSELDRRQVRSAVIVVAHHRCGPASVTMRLHVSSVTNAATVTATHRDQEGAFVEELDASGVLRCCGEHALDRELSRLKFESGISATLTAWDDLAAIAPDMLDH